MGEVAISALLSQGALTPLTGAGAQLATLHVLQNALVGVSRNCTEAVSAVAVRFSPAAARQSRDVISRRCRPLAQFLHVWALRIWSTSFPSDEAGL